MSVSKSVMEKLLTSSRMGELIGNHGINTAF